VRQVGLLATAVVVLTVALAITSRVPERVTWCGRDWVRSNLPATAQLPAAVAPTMPWTRVRLTAAGGFFLPLAGHGCPENTPTVGFLHHRRQYLSYELSGGP
jgi:hypothetical protein